MPAPTPNLPEGIEACLFDLDGVLTETAKVHAKAWKQMFDSYLGDRAEREGADFVAFDAAEDYNDYVDGKLRHDGVEAYPGSVRFLEAARDVGLRRAVSSPPAPTARRFCGRPGSRGSSRSGSTATSRRA